MKRFLQTILLFSSLIIFSASGAWALPMAGDTIRMSINPPAGKYQMQVTQSTDTVTIGDVYYTFCLESNMEFYNNYTYLVQSVEDYAADGGLSGADAFGRDYISDETRWLYASYFTGVFTGESNLENKIQNAIWYLEGEGDQYASSWNLLKTYATQLVTGAYDYSTSGWNIKAVNIVTVKADGSIIDRQSQLVGMPVPEPATMMLLGFGLIGIAGLGRKRIK